MSKKKEVLENAENDSLSYKPNVDETLAVENSHENVAPQSEDEMFSQFTSVAVANMANDAKSAQKSRSKVRAKKTPQMGGTPKTNNNVGFDEYSELDEDTLKLLRSAHEVANDSFEDDFTELDTLNFQPKIANNFPIITVVASLLWITGTALWAFAYPYTLNVPVDQLFTLSRFVIFTIASVLPIALFISAAMFMRHAKEMASTSQALAQSALRLMDPETLAHDTIQSVAGAVRREISTLADGVERALTRAGELETLVQAEVSSIEASYSQNEIRLRELIDNLVEQRGVISLEGDKLKALIAESQNSLSDRLASASTQMVQMVEHASSRASVSLEEKSTQISENLLDVSAKVLTALSERSDEMTKTLVDAEKSIVSSMQSTSDTLSATVGDRIYAITAEMDARSQSFVDVMTQQEQKLELSFQKTGNFILEGILERSTDANDALKNTADNLLTDLMMRSTELNSKWDELGSNISVRLQDQTLESINNIASEQEKLTTGLNSALASIEERISASEAQLSTVLSTQAQNATILLEEQKKSSAEALGKIAVDVSTLINDQITELQNTIEIRIEGLLSQLNIEGEQVSGALDDRLKQLTETLHKGSEELNSGRDSMNIAIEKLQQLATNHLSSSTVQLADILKNTVMETSDELLQKTSDTLELISSKTEAVINNFQNISTYSLTRVEEKLESFEARVLENTKEYSDSWNERIMGFDDSVSTKLQEMFVQFDTRIQRIDEAMVARTQHLNEVFINSTSLLANTLTQGSDGVIEDIELKTQTVAKTIEEQLKTFEAILDTYKDVSADKFAEHVTALTHRLELHSQTLEAQLNNHKAAHENSFQSHAEVIKISLEETLEALESHVNKDAMLITTTMSLHTNKMIEDIQAKTAEAADVLFAKTHELESMLSARAEAINSLVNTDLTDLNTNLTEKLELLTNTNGLFNQTINTGLSNLSQAIIETHSAIKDTLSTQGQESVNALRETQVLLSVTLADAVDKLNAQNTQLATLVHSAQNQLHAIGTDLSHHMNQFQSITTGAAIQTDDTIAKMAQQVSLLQRNTSTAMKEAQELSKEFEIQTDTMVHTMQNMEASAHNVKASMAERRESLTQLAQLIVSAAAEIDHKLGDATARIDDSLSLTTDHVERLTAALNAVAEKTSRDILSQFERMTLAAGDESMRTTEAVKRAYEDVSEEMSRGMRNATDEFRSASSGIKSLVNDVQNDILQTHEVLVNSLKKLPAETQHNTAELRRVVADQLRALNDLSDMISRQSGRLDISLPNETAQADRYNATPKRTSTAAKPSWFNQSTAASSYQPNEVERSADAFQPLETPALRKPAERKSSVRNETQETNWLKDLLNRAEDTAPAESTVSQSTEFTTFGADLARAVDTEALIDAWTQYRNGDRNAFSRRLYTITGQNTFDEVRRRYKRDLDFRTSVDRYCQDFEKLLSTVANKDKNGSIVLSYMTSDTGKVYTLLNHAAGNLS